MRSRSRAAGLVLVALCAAALVGASAVALVGPDAPRAAPSPLPAVPLPPVPEPRAVGLPPLPERSPRNASYTIEARVDPAKRTLTGSLVLEWRNTSEQAIDRFPFHLYWNAFRNDLSTTAREGTNRWSGEAEADESLLGWIQVDSVRLLGEKELDLTPSFRYIHPDGNEDDRTVAEVRSPRSIAPGETARFSVEWHARIPHGRIGRAGQVHDYLFIAQWFPKIGVFQDGAWNCHPFHAWTEFFSDFGVYDVRIRVPAGMVVGATGRLEGRTADPDGTETWHFVQEDVHDFAWTASRRFHERRAASTTPATRPVEIRLLAPARARAPRRSLPRGHEGRAARLRDLVGALSLSPTSRSWTPPGARRSGGMEYPTLFTGGHARGRAAARSRARRASPSTSPATSSGTGWSPTTSSRRRGSTRASTRT